LHIVEQLTLLSIIIFLFACIFGTATVRKHLFLLLLPVFAIPVWDHLTNPLVNLSGFIVGEMVRLIAIPAVIDGNSIFVPDGEIIIADGCSGLRYFTISLAIGYLISYLNGYSIKKLSIVLLIAAAIGLITNWLRIFILVIVGYQTKMQSSLMSDHEYFGWILFALIAFPAIYFAPVVKSLENKPSATIKFVAIVLPLVLLCTGPFLKAFIDLKPSQQIFTDILTHDYHPIPENKMPMKIQVSKSEKMETAVDSNNVYIQINQFQRTTEEEKLVPYLPRLFDNTVWSPQQKSDFEEKNDRINIFRNKHSGTVVVQAQWFEIANHSTTNYAIAKLLQIPAMLQKMNTFKIYTVQSICTNANCATEIKNVVTRSESLAKGIKENK
jgi:exosortase